MSNIIKTNHKKILTFGILFLLFGISIIPTINASIEKINKNQNIYQLPKSSDFPPYKLLIITPWQFAMTLKQLKRHKEKFGVSTYIVTLKEVYNKMYWNGRDKAEKIKYYIKEAIENWGTEYVLLVGGKMRQFNYWHLPARYINLGNSWERFILSDLYYADIYDNEGNFSSWDSDGDGIFCEWQYNKQPEDTHIDLKPDIAVGRLPCRNRLEAMIMVRKIINYEKTTYNKLWFNDMVAVAGDTYPEYINPKWAGNEGEYYADMAFENMTGFNQIKLYTSEGSLKGWRDIVTALSKGCGFVYFVGHGSAGSWNTHFSNDRNRTEGFGVFQIPRVFNRVKLPVCVVSGCHNCQFDASLFHIFNETRRYHGEAVPECWGWMMTRKIGGGSIATIGCTALGHTKEDKVSSFAGGINELEVEFFKQYGQNNVDIIGDTWASAINWYVDTYPVDWNTQLTNESWVDVQVASTWVLLGDPSLKIGGYPQSLIKNEK